MPMKNPPHPGRHIKMILDDCKLSITEAAAHLGVSRKVLSQIINGSAGVSAQMAVRIDKAFGGSADIWVRMQAGYDLAQIKSSDIKVKKFKMAIGQN